MKTCLYSKTSIVFFFAAYVSVFFTSPAAATIIADSQADFSGTQGQDNWFYGYYPSPFDSPSFQQLAVFEPSTQVWSINGTIPPWTLIGSVLMHPSRRNGFPHHAAVRRYVSEVTGSVRLLGMFESVDGSAGTDGVSVRILADGTDALTRDLANFDSTSFDLTLNLTVGDIVDFVVDAKANDRNDSVDLTAQFLAIPEPATAFLTGIGLLVCTLSRRRKWCR